MNHISINNFIVSFNNEISNVLDLVVCETPQPHLILQALVFFKEAGRYSTWE